MRGEKDSIDLIHTSIPGSPPHARRKVLWHFNVSVCPGITPACAGKSTAILAIWCSTRDHPRMRGEKGTSVSGISPARGSPPHARGKGIMLAERKRSPGITPACAGKRTRHNYKAPAMRDHPRMRGEKPPKHTQVPEHLGSPPHARGKAPHGRPVPVTAGITPACAGKSLYLLLP